MQRLTKHLTKKKTIGEIYGGVGFFLLISTGIQYSLPVIREGSVFSKLGFLAILGAALFLGGYHFSVHVIRPIVKVYHPSFTLPYADKNHVERKSLIENFLSPGNSMFVFLSLLTWLLGWTLIEMTLLSVSKTVG